jgi:ABC-type lipoprotein release transport system permease subunit
MLLLLKLAWRNVLRNKRRTLLSGIAVGICLAAIIFVDALLIGMIESMVRTATDTFLGHGQIHAEGFRTTMEVEKTISHPEGVLRDLEKEADIEGFTARTVSFGMLTSPANVSAVLLYGIDPPRERDMSMLDEAIVEGDYLEKGSTRGILIGSKAAELLEVGVGEKVVLTLAQAATGELSQEMFRVRGIFRFGIREADSAMAYIDLGKSQELLGLGSGVHEIALRFRDIQLAGDRSLGLWQRYSRDGNEAVGWKDIVPQLESAIELSDFSTLISLSLIFAIVALTVMNTLFMSLYERIYEFGVLRAIGTRPIRMALIIMLEAASLSVVFIAMGAAMGFLITWYFSRHGIDYVGIEFAGVTMRELLYPVLRSRHFTLFPFLIFLFTLIAATYPAVYAARLTPARAMRRSI